MKRAGIYIHIPFCHEKCDYCTFYSIAKNSVSDFGKMKDKYVDALANEIAYYADERGLSGEFDIDSIYFGGGTPGILEPRDVERILENLRLFRLVNPEITLEINPREAKADKLLSFRDAGINRFSLGVQTLDRDLYSYIGRKGGYGDDSALKAIASVDGVTYSFDLITGIPGQSTTSLKNDIDSLLIFNPHHISVYMLSVEEGSSLAKRVKLTDDDEDEQMNLFSFACDYLAECGYSHYEVSNFCRDSHYSRHNLKYWRFEPYIGFGAGVHSFYGRKRYSNLSDVEGYIKDFQSVRIEDKRTHSLEMAEFIMTGLRLREGFSLLSFINYFGGVPSELERSIREHIEKGVLQSYTKNDDKYIKISDESFYMTDSIIYDVAEVLLP